jgi:hypothetical protein
VDEERKEDLRRQLGTVWKMASVGLDTLREVVVRSSQAGRLRVDLALLQREKRDLLCDLGQAALRLADEGKLALPAELAPLARRVRDLEERMKVDAERVHDNAFGAPRGYAAEASSIVDDEVDASSADEAEAAIDAEADEHAEMAVPPTERKTKKGATR